MMLVKKKICFRNGDYVIIDNGSYSNTVVERWYNKLGHMYRGNKLPAILASDGYESYWSG